MYKRQIIHFALLKRPSKPESTPFFSVPAIGCEPTKSGCIVSHDFIIGSLIEPTSDTIKGSDWDIPSKIDLGKPS